MKLYYSTILLTLLIVFAKAQNPTVPILERKISLSISNETIPYILGEISQQAGFTFSYNPNIISTTSKTSIDIQNKSVRQVLNSLFNGTVKYKEKGKYLILQRNDLAKGEKSDKIVEGYLYDSQTGEKLTEATVYNKEQKVSAITNEYGYFKLEVPAEKAETELRVSKVGYTDTLISPVKLSDNYLNVEVSMNESKKVDEALIMPVETSTERKVNLPEWLIANNLLVNSRNISDTLFQKFQFSVLPFISTNRFLSGNTVNDYSLNMTIGFTQGVRIFETGGIANIVREDAGVCQLAGVANIVGGTSNGFQAAGTLNASKILNGIQAAGIINIVKNDGNFCQLAGTGNIVGGNFVGLQGAGTFNISGRFKGVQAAGTLNISGKLEGAQIAGVFNQASNIVGTQVAGVFNNANRVDGVQTAGVFNSADSIEGIQIAGIFNKATFIKGSQIAVFNFADSCDGLPIGMFSFVRKGYHKLEFSADEVFYTNIAFRSGVKQLHSIFSAGFQPQNFKNNLWTFGYGLGTTFGSSKKVNFDLDISSQQVVKGGYSSISSLNKLLFGVDWYFAPKGSLTFALSCNLFVTNTDSEYYSSTFSTLAPYTLTNKTLGNNINFKTWIGGKIGIRFF